MQARVVITVRKNEVVSGEKEGRRSPRYLFYEVEQSPRLLNQTKFLHHDLVMG